MAQLTLLLGAEVATGVSREFNAFTLSPSAFDEK